MAKKSVRERVPLSFIEKAKDIKKNCNFKHKTDTFNFMGNIQPIILDTKDIRLPKSKKIFKQIDVRYLFEGKK